MATVFRAEVDSQEVERAFRRYWRHGALEERWDDWATSVFTEDVQYVERVYGTMEGRQTVQAWISNLMANNKHIHAVLDWFVIEGNRVIVNMVNRYYHPDPTQPPLDFAGITVLLYEGDGRFGYEEDYWDLSAAKRCHAAFTEAVDRFGEPAPESEERRRLRDPWPV